MHFISTDSELKMESVPEQRSALDLSLRKARGDNTDQYDFKVTPNLYSDKVCANLQKQRKLLEGCSTTFLTKQDRSEEDESFQDIRKTCMAGVGEKYFNFDQRFRSFPPFWHDFDLRHMRRRLLIPPSKVELDRECLRSHPYTPIQMSDIYGQNHSGTISWPRSEKNVRYMESRNRPYSPTRSDRISEMEPTSFINRSYSPTRSDNLSQLDPAYFRNHCFSKSRRSKFSECDSVKIVNSQIRSYSPTRSDHLSDLKSAESRNYSYSPSSSDQSSEIESKDSYIRTYSPTRSDKSSEIEYEVPDRLTHSPTRSDKSSEVEQEEPRKHTYSPKRSDSLSETHSPTRSDKSSEVELESYRKDIYSLTRSDNLSEDSEYCKRTYSTDKSDYSSEIETEQPPKRSYSPTRSDMLSRFKSENSRKRSYSPTRNEQSSELESTEPRHRPYSPKRSDSSSYTKALCKDVTWSPQAIIRTVNGVSMRLQEEELWNAFRAFQTEMIVNRGGRRMFPHVIVAIEGLDPEEIYSVAMEIVDADDRRYKYVNDRWIAIGIADPSPARTAYIHPDSPNTGTGWTKTSVSFAKARLTNNKESQEAILLHSMHKYLVAVTITEESKNMQSGGRVMRFDFPETTFIAVTAYQNRAITRLKIQNNPFAKAFRHMTTASKRVQAGNSIDVFENRYKEANNVGYYASLIPAREGRLSFPEIMMLDKLIRSKQQPCYNIPYDTKLSRNDNAASLCKSLYGPWFSSRRFGYTLPPTMPVFYHSGKYCTSTTQGQDEHDDEATEI